MIAGAVARRDAHAAADGQRHDAPKSRAHAGALLVDVVRRFHVMGMLIAEGDVAVDEIGDGLDPRPRRLACWPNSDQAEVGELVGLAIAARHQIEQELVRQTLDRDLLRGRAAPHAGSCGIAHQRVAAQGDAAGGRDQAPADIAETVAIEADSDVRARRRWSRCRRCRRGAQGRIESMITVGVGAARPHRRSSKPTLICMPVPNLPLVTHCRAPNSRQRTRLRHVRTARCGQRHSDRVFKPSLFRFPPSCVGSSYHGIVAQSS